MIKIQEKILKKRKLQVKIFSMKFLIMFLYN
jgi:hypothetical protein